MAGYQGPGEEFGNSWDSFSTGQGNFMSDGAGNRSNGMGVWSHTGTTNPMVSHVSGPVNSAMRPQARPVPGAPVPQLPGILGMLFGQGGLFSGRKNKKQRNGFLNSLLEGGGDSSGFGRVGIQDDRGRVLGGKERPPGSPNAFADLIMGTTGTETEPEPPIDDWVTRNAAYRARRHDIMNRRY